VRRRSQELEVLNYHQQSRLINHYFLGSWLFTLYLCSTYLTGINWSGGWAVLFSLAVYLSYAALYLLPAVLLTKVLHWGLSGFQQSPLKWLQTVVLYSVAVFSTVVTNILIFTDGTIFTVFGFHFNSFVWNLITTPGGIESMGSGSASYTSVALVLAGILSAQIVLMLLLITRYKKYLKSNLRQPVKLYRYLIAIFFTLTLGERIGYVMGDIYAYGPVYETSSAFPYYKQTKFRTLASWLNLDIKKRNDLKAYEDGGSLNYPLKPLQIKTPANKMNVIWLVAESLRWDMLDKEIMPNTWSFAENAHRFKHHYSGGNGTRMGMFSMFYGLYGPYWNQFLAEHRSPVLMDVLQDQGYQMEMFTSAKFTYPEFDKTIFARIPKKHLHQDAPGKPPERDRVNIDRMMSFIDKQKGKNPFMTFMFFESTHARYYYPDAGKIRKSSLKEIDYLNTSRESLEKDIVQIKNRYINASHYVDSQIGRLLRYLTSKNLLDNTIVVITGDHGEEFMEKGRWGHNSDFVEEQIRTPLVLWIPGSGASVDSNISSHLDIVSTILPWLGVENKSSDYSNGYNLLSTAKRPFAVVSDWTRVAYIGPEYKYSIAYRRGVLSNEKVKNSQDKVIGEEDLFFSRHQTDMLKIISNMRTFHTTNSQTSVSNNKS